MRIRLPLGRSLFFVCALLLSLAALIPLRLGLAWLGLDQNGVAAREARGSVWNGALTEAQFGGSELGDLRAGLGLSPLLIGRARVAVERTAGDASAAPQDQLEGAVTVTRRGFGFDDFRARLGAGNAFSPLAMRALALDDVSVRFENGLCVAAEGLVSAELGGELGGIALPSSLSGNARCDEGALLLPLTSQSGMEQLNLRLGAAAVYTLELIINPGDEAQAARLANAGFAPGPSGYIFTLAGTL